MTDSDNWLLWAIAGLVVLMVGLIVIETIAHKSLFDDCLADGKKHYECAAMLNPKTIYIR